MKIMRLVTLLLLFMVSTACSVKPWVKPYERQNIADKVMSFERDPVANSYLHHVYDARESARGGDGASGGGCGCN
jgi:hypothetical protein